MTGIHPATIPQNEAAEPGHSTWLSANAGSGKTRVLTNRVARLLLDGVPPQSILCLTYTKAAASEMQNRLFEQLGDWSMEEDAKLKGDLAALGVENPLLADARRLFARAIETPGGLRIQTIHSFCASLLRRFPLEAGVTPNFLEMDDRSAARLCDEVMEALAEDIAPEAVDALAEYYSGDDELMHLTRAIAGRRDSFEPPAKQEEIWRWHGLPKEFNDRTLLSEAFPEPPAELIGRLVEVLASSISTRDGKALDKIRDGDWSAPGLDEMEILSRVMLFGGDAKSPFGAKIGQFPTKAAREALGEDIDRLNEMMARIESARERQKLLWSAQKSLALQKFAGAFLPEYEKRKQKNGWLDFDDLILKTRALLSNPSVASWVLYRLDGGLSHILVDEAQDTSPEQWQVIEYLSQEFSAGEGARENASRTIFAVGDKKQSIYSFQGADPREFDRMQDRFGNQLGHIGEGLRRMELQFSFRSSKAVLQFVDLAAGFPKMKHSAFHEAFPGRVDLWPAEPPTSQPEKKNWYDPVDIVSQDHHTAILADKLADEIGRMINEETIPENDGTRRPVNAGDIMILVRRRSNLFEEIIRACKTKGLDVAGADRLKLGAELAVKDLSAILSYLATPEDDLSLASALRSPLFGWSEAELFGLAHGRKGFLKSALASREEEFPQTVEMLRDLRKGARFLRPYDLIERILIHHDGRRKLLARLGPEAEEGIDALLQQALGYERIEIPDLAGFLTWLQTDDVQVKRQMDSAGDLIRVMTVHGAKGLEAPIVILPDTARWQPPLREKILLGEGTGALWKLSADEQPELQRTALEKLKDAQDEEDERLFYVAATRAETWLIIAAAGDTGEEEGDSWHRKSESALMELNAQTFQTPTGPGLRLTHLDWFSGNIAERSPVKSGAVEIPDWARKPAACEQRRKSRLTPSKLGGDKSLPGGGTDDSKEAAQYGTCVHLLLEKLSNVPASNRADYARRLLSSEDPSLSNEMAAKALAEAEAVLNVPGLAYLFEPEVLAEVEFTAKLELPEFGVEGISGIIDRLVVSDGSVLAVDFKTNASIPAAVSGIPEGIMRQMGAYQIALERIYPGKSVETAILWTKGPSLMTLPRDATFEALQRAEPHLDEDE